MADIDSDTDHDHAHHRLVEEIAQRVEEKIVAKFAKWVVGNAIAVILAIGGGIAAYYDVKSETRIAIANDAVQDHHLYAQEAEQKEAREALDRKLDVLRAEMRAEFAEMNRFLREHAAGQRR